MLLPSGVPLGGSFYLRLRSDNSRAQAALVPRTLVTDKPVDLIEDDVAIPDRDPVTNRFLVGNKLGGRVKGSRNKITRLRLEMEEALRLNLRDEAESLLAHAILMAKTGDSVVMKALLDKILTTPKDDEDANKKPESVKVIVVTQAASPPTVTVTKIARDPVTLDNAPT